MNTFISDFISTKLEHQDFSSNKKVIITSAEKNQFDQVLDKLGMSMTNVKDSYKDLKTTYDELPKGMRFGASLNELATEDIYEGLYNGASGLNLDYAEKRTEVLAQLIQVMEIAKQTGNPRIVEHFLKRTEAAAKKSGMKLEDSLHWRELEAAARFATEDDSVATRLINSNKKSCFLDVESIGADTCVFDAALEELKTRHAHISQITAGPNTNAQKHGALIGGAADFGFEGAMKTVALGSTIKAGIKYKEPIGRGLSAAWTGLKAFGTKLVPQAGKLLTCFPGWGKLIGLGIAAAGVASKIVVDCKEDKPWTKAVGEYFEGWSAYDVAMAPVKLLIPDVGKFWGGSIYFWENNTDQQALREGVLA